MSKSFFNEYFHFTKGERTGTVILLILITFVLLLTFLLPLFIRKDKVDFSAFEKEIERFQAENAMDSLKNTPVNKSLNKNKTPERFFFNPNTISGNEMELLGLNKKVVNTWLKYREKGGVFRKKEDLKKIYGLSDKVYMELEPYINLPEKRSFYKEEEKQSHETIDNTESRFEIPAKIELNSADSADLIKLKGIGPVYAGRIIAYRELLGGFYTGEQLEEVYGLTKEIVKSVLSFTSVDTSLIHKLNLNTATLGELMRHPYLNRYQGKAILQFRKVQGGFKSVAELKQNNLLPDEVYHKILPYLTVEGIR